MISRFIADAFQLMLAAFNFLVRNLAPWTLSDH